MVDPIKRFLSDSELAQIDACVREAEHASRGQIVVLVAPASYHYPMADIVGGAAFAIPAAVAIARWLGPLVWAGPHDLWIFLGSFFPLLFLCRALITRLPRVKRLFVSAKEMDHEVKEAATVHFFDQGLYRTREANGVLLYLSVFEGRVRVLGDKGIDAAVPSGFWQEVVNHVSTGIRNRWQAAAICEAVRRIGTVLTEKFPPVATGTDELPNLILDS